MVASTPGDFPPAIGARLDALVRERFAPAWLHVDRRGALIEAGGDLERYGLETLGPGVDAAAAFPALEGYLPAREAALVLPDVELTAGCCVEIHLLRGPAGDWVLLLDTTAGRSLRQALQQCRHELSLERERRESD